MINYKPLSGDNGFQFGLNYICVVVTKGQGEVATQKCNCFHSPSPQNTTPLLMIQGNIIRQEKKFPSTHISIGTSIPITKTSKPIIKISLLKKNIQSHKGGKLLLCFKELTKISHMQSWKNMSPIIIFICLKAWLARSSLVAKLYIHMY
jgi:hypothetical protein